MVIKMNKKGFTLVELLAVLVILLTILLIAIPSITSSVERNKENALKKKYDLIEAAAESYVNLYQNEFNYNNFISGSCKIYISRLEGKGLLTDEDLKNIDNVKIKGYVKYEKESNKYVFESTDSDDEDGSC